jgi:alkylation response protein AidB-like acyl-CoA dehydrogenase
MIGTARLVGCNRPAAQPIGAAAFMLWPLLLLRRTSTASGPFGGLGHDQHLGDLLPWQGPEGSLGKLASSHIARAAARIHTSLLGPDALLTGDDTPMNGLLAEILVSVPATSIAGGTDGIQRNIISERVLKMPRERTGDTDKPFKDVLRNIVA